MMMDDPDDDGAVEIEFSPMDMSQQGDQGQIPGPLMEMLQGGGSARKGSSSMRGPARGGREAELDNMLASVLGGMMDGQGGGRGGGQRGAGMPPGMTEEIVVEGPDGTQVMTMGGSGPGDMQRISGPGAKGKNSLPAGLLRNLFPGASFGPGGPVVVEGSSGGGFGRSPFGADPMMKDIMQDLDRSFAQDMMPAIQKAAAGNSDPAACQEDVKKNCAGATSHLHCLGANHDIISEACRKEVGQSVPFRCSKSIDRFCDVLQMGILDCLYSHMQDLESDCRDAVLTTKHVINKVNTQKASLLDPSTGIKKVSTPATNIKDSSPTDKEAKLDAQLGLTPRIAVPRSVTAISPLEAKLDAQLGLTPKVAVSRSDSAIKPLVDEARALDEAAASVRHLASLEAQRVERLESGWFPHGFSGFLVLALLAFAVYFLAFTDYTQQVQSRFRGDTLEGAKLLEEFGR